MRFCSLGSGSRGNATLIEAGATQLLVDCGYSVKELEARLQQCGVDPQDLDALLVTHEHGDHIRGANAFARRYGIPVWATPGTLRHQDWHTDVDLQVVHCGMDLLTLGSVHVTPYTVPHDAREPCQFIFSHAGKRLAMLTDAGSITSYMIDQLGCLDAFLLECNHDTEMLRQGPYSAALKARVAGDHGHLSNRQAADLLAELPLQEMQHLVVAHISETNNRPDLAIGALRAAAPNFAGHLTTLAQDHPSSWFDLT